MRQIFYTYIFLLSVISVAYKIKRGTYAERKY